MFPNRILIGWLVLVSSVGDVGFLFVFQRESTKYETATG